MPFSVTICDEFDNGGLLGQALSNTSNITLDSEDQDLLSIKKLTSIFHQVDMKTIQIHFPVELDTFVHFLWKSSCTAHELSELWVDYSTSLGNEVVPPLSIPSSLEFSPTVANSSARTVQLSHQPSQVLTYIHLSRWDFVAEAFKQAVDSENKQLIQAIYAGLCSIPENIYDRVKGLLEAMASSEDNFSNLPANQFITLACLTSSIMLETYHLKQVEEAFRVLKLMHSYKLNYAQIFIVLSEMGIISSPKYATWRQFLLSVSHIALTRIDICLLCKKKEEAFIEFEGCDWIQAENGSNADVFLPRAKLLLELCLQFQEMKQCSTKGVKTLGVLLEALDSDTKFGMIPEEIATEINVCFNNYLASLLNECSFDQAESLYELKCNNTHSALEVHSSTMRAFVIVASNCGMKSKSQQFFTYSYLKGIYSACFKDLHSSPHSVILQTCLSTCEMEHVIQYSLEDLFQKFARGPTKTHSLDNWFSLQIVFEVLSVEEKIPYLNAVHGISSSVKKAKSRAMAVLIKMGLVGHRASENPIIIAPCTLYKRFLHWLERKSSANNNNFTVVSNLPSEQNSFCGTFQWKPTKGYSLIPNLQKEHSDTSCNKLQFHADSHKCIVSPAAHSTETFPDVPSQLPLFQQFGSFPNTCYISCNNVEKKMPFVKPLHPPSAKRRRKYTFEENLLVYADKKGRTVISDQIPQSQATININDHRTVIQQPRVSVYDGFKKGKFKKRYSCWQPVSPSGFNLTKAHNRLAKEQCHGSDKKVGKNSKRIGGLNLKIEQFILSQVVLQHKRLSLSEIKRTAAERAKTLTQQFLEENHLCSVHGFKQIPFKKLIAFTKSNL